MAMHRLSRHSMAAAAWCVPTLLWRHVLAQSSAGRRQCFDAMWFNPVFSASL